MLVPNRLVFAEMSGEIQDFHTWMLQEMKERDLSQADLSRKTKLSTAAISLVVGSGRGAGPEACRAIARAFDLSEEFVFRKAGLLSPISDKETAIYEEWRVLLNSLNDHDRNELLRIAKMLLEWEGRLD